MAKKITILGSTGSIGQNAVKFILQHKNDFEVVGLVGGSNWKLMIEQARLLKPKYVSLTYGPYIREVQDILGPSIKVLFAEDSACEIAAMRADIVLAAMSGFAGLMPLLQAIEAGNNIALANKESLVCGGAIVMACAKQNNVRIIPVDSEHSAIFQIFDKENDQFVDSIYLTCSGGPFRGFTSGELEHVTLEQALKHPRWKMGAKVTIDSATLMNKALEKIEAHYLFNMPSDKIKIILHPESIIHGMLTFVDGSMLAQLSNTDMIIPISYALSWPERKHTGYSSIDFQAFASLTFAQADVEVFPSLQMVDDVMKDLGKLGAAFNAANEVAVQAFLQNKIRFVDIFNTISTVLEDSTFIDVKNIEDVLMNDQTARLAGQYFIDKISSRL
jgi:1-deoxy-D-xylulose-5-phosphate reductoisomerase